MTTVTTFEGRCSCGFKARKRTNDDANQAVYDHYVASHKDDATMVALWVEPPLWDQQ